MTFKELRQNLPIHILDKSEMVYAQGKVVNVGMPRINAQQGQQANFGAMPPMQMVVDVTVEWNGKTNTYTLQENASAAAVGSTLVATDKADIVKELQATKADCEQYLANVDKRKEQLEQCDKLIGELDTEYKEKAEITNRLNDLDSKYDKVIEGQNKIMEMIQNMQK